MKRFLLLMVLLNSGMVWAQTSPQFRTGVNLIPLLARTAEAAIEYRPHPAYGITLHGGYTDRTSFAGFSSTKESDLIENRITSGAFVKLGGRLYWSRLRRPEKNGSFFTGLQIIGSQYDQRFNQLISGTVGFSKTPFHLSGYVGGAALTMGYNLTSPRSRWGLDIGFQYAMQQRRSHPMFNDPYPGIQNRNYQPGFGRTLAGRVPTSLQGIFTLSYRL